MNGHHADARMLSVGPFPQEPPFGSRAAVAQAVQTVTRVLRDPWHDEPEHAPAPDAPDVADAPDVSPLVLAQVSQVSLLQPGPYLPFYFRERRRAQV